MTKLTQSLRLMGRCHAIHAIAPSVPHQMLHMDCWEPQAVCNSMHMNPQRTKFWMWTSVCSEVSDVWQASLSKMQDDHQHPLAQHSQAVSKLERLKVLSHI